MAVNKIILLGWGLETSVSCSIFSGVFQQAGGICWMGVNHIERKMLIASDKHGIMAAMDLKIRIRGLE